MSRLSHELAEFFAYGVDYGGYYGDLGTMPPARYYPRSEADSVAYADRVLGDAEEMVRMERRDGRSVFL
jgi:hypothetical protein